MVDIAEAPPVIPAASSGDHELTPARLRVAAVCMLGLALGTTVLPFSIVSAALVPMMLELGWGANQVQLSYSLMMWAGAISVWPVGLFIDRYGARSAVTVSAIAIAAVGFLLPFVGRFWQFCALFALLGVCSGFGLAYSKIVASIFVRGRGAALGIFAAEGAALAMFLPLAAGRLVHETGWRGAFTILGLIGLALAPLLWSGLAAGGLGGKRPCDTGSDGLEASKAVRGRAFWLIVLGGLLSGLVGNVALNGFEPALVHRGFVDGTTLRGTPIGLMALLAGPVCAGLLLDRTRSPIVAIAAYVISAVSCVIVGVVTPGFGGKPLLMTGFVLGALAFSAQAPMVGYLFSRYFGLRSFATTCSLLAFIQAVLTGMAGPAVARLMQPFGDAPMLFVLGAGAPLAAALLFVLLPAYRYGAPREPAPGAAGQSPQSFRTWWSRAPS